WQQGQERGKAHLREPRQPGLSGSTAEGRDTGPPPTCRSVLRAGGFPRLSGLGVALEDDSLGRRVILQQLRSVSLGGNEAEHVIEDILDVLGGSILVLVALVEEREQLGASLLAQPQRVAQDEGVVTGVDHQVAVALLGIVLNLFEGNGSHKVADLLVVADLWGTALLRREALPPTGRSARPAGGRKWC